ncbi:S8 family serine peptidase [Paenimyroides baculatum]|uniref:S8 family serine peptidase n=1 Tax=Paenimyroides baculatum TaxID=2608000 RepID=A0A5M6CCJ7_9FLAO|nr:S8 family serine peptidase [Paenimyroides baculatum]KAA5532874.1 S8 family serine peptidase [Paenimyroides baculatum]
MKNKITKLFLVLMLSGFVANAQTDKERQQIISKTDVLFLNNLTKELEIKNEKNLKAATEKALRLGYPLEGVESDGSFYQLVGFYEGTTDLKYYKTYNKQDYNTLMYFNNNGTASSLNTLKATYLHNKDILGQGMIAGEWDGGAPVAAHFAIAGRVTLRDNGATPVNGSVAHATHVAGTIISSGEGAPGLDATKGFLPKGRLWAANWDNDNSEMSAAAAAGLLVSNHSYGPSASQGGFSKSMFGQYNSEARLFDLMSNANPFYTIVVAAGNDRDNYTTYQPTKGGRDLLTTMGVSKNLVTVAAVNGISNYVNSNSVVMSTFSNWGPTDDYRIKPDISAKGVNVLSLGTGTTSTATESGTSMAAPAVTGAIGLWQQYYNSLFTSYMLSSTVRAMLAHTAMEAGANPGPDPEFGWGVMNVEGGAKLMEDYVASKAWILQKELNNGNFFSNTFEYDGVSELKATLAWNDPAGTSTAGNDERFPRLVNDLDLRIINEDTQQEFLPWSLRRTDNIVQKDYARNDVDNVVDNVEKVEVKNAPAGNYRVVVSHKGTLVGGKQMYSLLLSGSGTTLSAKEHLFSDVKVFPNPTQNVLNILLPKEIALGVTYDIYDASGKKVKQYSNKVDSDNLTIDVSGLTSGVYVLTVKTTQGSSSYKFIKK